jgi:Tfp pilus assembly protein PilF
MLSATTALNLGKTRSGLVATASSMAMVLMLAFCLPPAVAGDGTAHFERALQYQFQGDNAAAIVEYRKGLEEDPNSVDGHTRLGVLLLEQLGDVDSAISEFVTALGIDPDCGYCQSQLDAAVDRRNSTSAENILRGNDYYRAGQLTRSVGSYRVAVYVDPTNAEAHNSLAWTLYRLGNLDESLRNVKEALRLKPDDAEYINTLACILYDKGDIEGSIKEWQKAIQLSKKANPADLYGLAIGFLSKGDTMRAKENFKQALASDPNYADAGYLRDKIGMSVHALAWHEKLLSLSNEKQK